MINCIVTLNLCYPRNREAENIVLPELVELATDEAALVREASFDTLVAILPYVDTGNGHLFI